MALRAALAAETSIWRALRVVEVVAEVGDGVTPKAIARRLNFTLPTTYRLLATLVEEGYLVRLPEPRGYGLGYRIGELARRLTDQVTPPAPVRAILYELHRAVGGATYYAVFRGTDVVVAHLDECPAHPAPGPLRVGEPAAAHASAAGKVLLAALDRRRLGTLLADPLPALTPRTVLDRTALDRELERVREVGVAVELGELVLGRAGVAAAVRAPDGTVTGALGVSVRGADFAPRRAGLEHAVREAAGRAAGVLAERAAAG